MPTRMRTSSPSTCIRAHSAGRWSTTSISSRNERQPAAKNIRAQLAAFLDKPMIVTEYGAMGFHGLRGGVPSSEDFQAAYIKTIWDAIAGDPELSGGVLWSWADYHHCRNFLSLGAFGAFGVVTIDRQPKASLRALAEAYGGTAAR